VGKITERMREGSSVKRRWGMGIVGCKEENENGSPQRGLEKSDHGSEMTLSLIIFNRCMQLMPRRIESPDGVLFFFFF
jgi:hypothetical protein